MINLIPVRNRTYLSLVGESVCMYLLGADRAEYPVAKASPRPGPKPAPFPTLHLGPEPFLSGQHTESLLPVTYRGVR